MESFKDKVEDLHEGLKERLKSPFILTFVTVWIIRHWDLAYLVFNFGADYTAIQKLKMVIISLKGEGYWELFWVPLFISLASFIIYLIVSLIYELIHSLYSKWGRTLVYYISDRNKIIKREDYDELQKEFYDLDVAYEELEENYESLKEDNLDKFNKLNERDEKINTQEISNTELLTQNNILRDEITKLKKIEEDYDKIKEQEHSFLTSRAKNVMYHLFRYFFIEKVYDMNYVPLTNLFFGAWRKKLIKRDDLSTQLSSTDLKFEVQNAIDVNGNYSFKIDEILKLLGDDIYLVRTINSKNEKALELIFKISPELYFGLSGTNVDVTENMSDVFNDLRNNFNINYIVQYERIKIYNTLQS